MSRPQNCLDKDNSNYSQYTKYILFPEHCTACCIQEVYYRPQTKFAKVMFLHVSVSHSVHRGGLPQCMLGYHPPRTRPPPQSRHPQSRPPQEQTPPAQCILGDTVNKRTVCILLKCNLVIYLRTFCKIFCNIYMYIHLFTWNNKLTLKKLFTVIKVSYRQPRRFYERHL